MRALSPIFTWVNKTMADCENSVTEDLLIEIGTEELPPKSLERLSEAFLDGICRGLEEQNLAYRAASPFATPRRLAVLVRGVELMQADQNVERRGPALQAAYDKEGNPSKAAQGFARSCGVEMDQLETLETDKGSWLVFRSVQAGRKTAELLPDIIRNAIAGLPVAKRMRWGANDFEFVRPVHWLVVLLGKDIVECEMLGVKSGRETRGHRFHAPANISLACADDYSKALETEGRVLPVISVRKARVRTLVEEAAEVRGAYAVIDEDLLSEVTSLVEYPVAIVGNFEERFLDVPAEALIAAMKGHQKYFHMVDADGKLLPHFITMSNVESSNPATVQSGNERVIRPRLSDAMFFWEQDKAQPLAARLEPLKNVIFEKRLGSVYDKAQRVAKLSAHIAGELGADKAQGQRAGELCKCDLLSEMVGEFPELQGIMGEYYARHDQEASEVAQAIREHYMPRFWGDELPASATGQAAALADRLDTLVGIFGIGQAPTGDKDPYGLRRAAIGALRILIEQSLALDLKALLEQAVSAYPAGCVAEDTAEQVFNFALERLRYYYQEQGLNGDSIDAVLSCRPVQPLDAHQRIRAVETFRVQPEAASLAAANKRIHNILKKVEGELPSSVSAEHIVEAEEKALYEALMSLEAETRKQIAAADYAGALAQLSTLRETVDAFFDKVMVMVDDEQVRNNRLALLQSLRQLFLAIADISRLN